MPFKVLKGLLWVNQILISTFQVSDFVRHILRTIHECIMKEISLVSMIHSPINTCFDYRQLSD